MTILEQWLKQKEPMTDKEINDLVVAMRKRVEIRRSIPRHEPDRIADQLEQACNVIESLQSVIMDQDKELDFWINKAKGWD